MQAALRLWQHVSARGLFHGTHCWLCTRAPPVVQPPERHFPDPMELYASGRSTEVERRSLWVVLPTAPALPWRRWWSTLQQRFSLSNHVELCPEGQPPLPCHLSRSWQWLGLPDTDQQILMACVVWIGPPAWPSPWPTLPPLIPLWILWVHDQADDAELLLPADLPSGPVFLWWASGDPSALWVDLLLRHITQDMWPVDRLLETVQNELQNELPAGARLHLHTNWPSERWPYVYFGYPILPSGVRGAAW